MIDGYFDHNASSPLRPMALKAMADAYTEAHGNPSSQHKFGNAAKSLLDRARSTVSGLLRCGNHEIIFTSGATEANNLAILGTRLRVGASALVTTRIEHPSVLRPIERLARQMNFEIRYLETDSFGRIQLDSAHRLIDDAVALVSVHHANHELGVLQPVEEISAIASRFGATVHIDAAQSVGRVPFHVCGDLVTIASHKLGGPLGIGALLRRDKTIVDPLIVGGQQEGGYRAGTPSPALAVGFTAALQESLSEVDAQAELHQASRLRVLARLIESGVQYHCLTSLSDSIPNTLCISFPATDRQALLIQLDFSGISISAGAACSSGALTPSPVLSALALPPEIVDTAVRISMGWSNNSTDIDRLLAVLPTSVKSAAATTGST
jgi:cysteine desulfurase